MKILMIAPEPFLEPRGTPISVYQRLQALSALEHQVDLLTYHVGQDVSIPGVTVHRVLHVPFIKRVKIGPSCAKVFLDILLFFQAIILLVRNQYDAIHSHEEAAFLSVPLSRAFHTCHVYDMHSSLPQQLANFGPWNRWALMKLAEMLERWTLGTCDAVITVARDLEEHVLALNPEAKPFLIENLAVHTHDATTSHGSARELKERIELDHKLPIVYTGTFERYQGLDLLLKSAKIVKGYNPDISFIMVGGSPQQVTYWRNEAISHGLEDCMLFTGSVPLAEAAAYLDMAEILVSPRTDGTSVPLKIYSYLSSGRPIVATNLAPHTQVLNDETALLVAPNEEAFAHGILALVRSPDLRRRLGHRAQQFARERFGYADYLAKVSKVYQELLPSTFAGEKAALASLSDPACSGKQSPPPAPQDCGD